MAFNKQEYQKQYYQSHKEQCRTKHREWMQAHPTYNRRYKKQLKWYDFNRERRQKRIKLWLQVLELYGNKCPCCGEDLRAFGTVEHLKGNGAEHRRQYGTLPDGQTALLEDVIRENDKTTYRVSCWNCHLGAHMNDGMCPHQTDGKSLRMSLGRPSNDWGRPSLRSVKP